MTCRCDALEARLDAIERQLGITRQPSLFGGSEPAGESKYTAEFEKCWEATGRVGGKAPAFRAWLKAGRPPHALISLKWTEYLRSDRPVRLKAIKDFSTWLNERGHTQNWPAAYVRTQVVPPTPASTGPTYAAPVGPCFKHAEDPLAKVATFTPGCPTCDAQRDDAMDLPPWAAEGEMQP